MNKVNTFNFLTRLSTYTTSFLEHSGYFEAILEKKLTEFNLKNTSDITH